MAVLALCTALAAIGLASPAGAVTNHPSVRSFTALPSALPTSGGTVTLSARVEHASRCVFSSSATLDGLPLEVDCAKGSTSDQVTVPANTTSSEKKISFHLEAINRTRRSEASRVVVEKAAAPGAGPLVASPSTLPAAGGSVTLSDTVSGASSCTFSGGPGLTELPVAKACSSGDVAVSVSIPAETTAGSSLYSFSLTVSGPGGTIHRDVSVGQTAPPPPTVGSVEASPSSLPNGGGAVSLSASVSGADSCTYSASPALAGFPLEVACRSGTATTRANIPPNPSTSPVSYTFSLSANGVGGATTGPSPATVTEEGAPAPYLGPAPTVGAVSANRDSLPDSGGTVDLSTTVSGARTCEYTASPALTGFPLDESCSSGTAAATASIPANSSGSSVTYTFSLIASGAGGTTDSAGPATVTEAAAPPTAGTVSANPDSLPDSGGTVDLSTTVSGAQTCEYTASPALAGFPLDESCSSGTAAATASIPANSSGSSVTYTFSLIASGAGGTTDSAGPATVTEAGVSEAAFPLSWSAGNELEAPDVNFAAISCPTTSFCAAADNQNGETTTYQAGTWSTPASTEPGGQLTMISCASDSLCLTSDGNSLFVFDGATWSTATGLPTGLSIGALSCAPGGGCMAIDDMGDAYTTSNGTSWSTVAPLANSAAFPVGLSCLSASSCVAVALSEGTDPATAGVEVWNGTSWSSAGGSWSSSFSPSDFSCVSGTSCMAEEYDENTSSLEVELYSGSAWTTSSLPGGATVGGGLSCDVGGDCFVLGFTDSGPALYAYTAGSWSAVAGMPPGTGALSCASSSFCGAVASNQASTYNGANWSTATVGSDAQVTDIACTSSSWCMAVDNVGNALTYQGTSWSAPSPTGAFALIAVSCSSSSFCAALDSVGDVYIYNGTSWSSPVADQMIFTTSGIAGGGISCWSTSGCVAVFGSEAAVYDGSSWAVSDVDPTNSDLSSVSCPAAGSCVAVDASGAALSYGAGSWSPPATIDSNASSWPSNLEWVSCLTSSVCAAGGYDGYAEFLDGDSWSSPDQLANGSSINGVSCATTGGFCVLASFDDVYYLEASGDSYGFSEAQSVVSGSANPGDGLLRIGCGPSACVGSTFENGGYYGSESVSGGAEEGSRDSGHMSGLATGARPKRGVASPSAGALSGRPGGMFRLTP